MSKKKEKHEEESVIVFGGTGHYGREIVKKLLNKDKKVRVLSRNLKKAKNILGDEVDIIEGDVTCRDSVIQSLEWVNAVMICLSAMNIKLIKKLKEIERDAVLMIMEEARKAKIERLVYMSGYEIREEVLKRLNMIKFGEVKLEIEK